MKSYSSRALTSAGFEHSGRKRWTRGGSARYLWSDADIDRAVHYVLYEQGEPFVTYEQCATERYREGT